jgi:hypothetical protein
METNPLWLITGVDVLVPKKAYFKMSQKIKKLSWCTVNEFCEKRHFIVTCVKRQKKNTRHKNIFSLQNFVSEHIIFRCTLENFIQFF